MFSFIIDVFSRKIVGWQLASHMRTDLALDALAYVHDERTSDLAPADRDLLTEQLMSCLGALRAGLAQRDTEVASLRA